jgi:serine/threonine protein kinase
MLERPVADEALVARLPLPMAQLYRRAYNAQASLERHLAAFYLWEASLKLLGCVSVVEYARRGTPAPELAGRLQNLARPALGHWWEFVRVLVPVLADAGDEPFRGVRDLLLGRTRDDLPRAAGLDAALCQALDGKTGARATVRLAELFDRLVRFRNEEMGHGAAGQKGGEHYQRLGLALLTGLGELLGRLDVLAGRRLIHVADVRRLASGDWLVERSELIGEASRRLESLQVPEADASQLPRPGRLYLEAANAPAQSLHPLVVYDVDSAGVFFLNASRGKRKAQYLCYSSGAVVQREELGQERRELLARVLGGPVDGASEAAWEANSQAGEPAAETPPARRTLGEFELISRLGRGGMGVVYRAWQPSLGRQVALKCLLRSGDPKAEARFAREVRALGQVEHPHLVKVFTSGAEADQWFYAMELVEGADLAAVVEELSGSAETAVDEAAWTRALSGAAERQRQCEESLGNDRPADTPQPAISAPAAAPRARRGGAGHIAQVVEVVRQVAEAAHALHEAGVIHRDIKPGNILLTESGHAVLMDLGLAQLTDEAEGRLTRTRQFVGTLRYASPEQVLAADRLDRRTDVYSLGATLWELLTLCPLFDADEQMRTSDLMLKIQTTDPDPVRKHNRSVPADLEAIVMKCLEKDRGRRYATAAELAADLARWQCGEPVLAQPPSVGYLLRKYLRRHQAALALTAGVVLALVGVVVAAFLRISMALEAEKEARGIAETKKTEALNASAELEKANTLLQEKSRVLVGILAKSLLRPLGQRADSAKNEPLTDSEIEALWELAESDSTDLRYRFVKEALRSPLTTRQLRVRAEPAIHAAVGLDRRKQVLIHDLLAEVLQDRALARQVREDVESIKLVLGNPTPATPPATSTTEAPGTTRPPEEDRPRVTERNREWLNALQRRVLAADAARAFPAAEAVVTYMARETDATLLREAAELLVVAAKQLGPLDVKDVSDRALNELRRAFSKTTDPSDLLQLARALLTIAPLLNFLNQDRVMREIAFRLAPLPDSVQMERALRSDFPKIQGLDRYWEEARRELAPQPGALDQDRAATIIRSVPQTGNPQALRKWIDQLAPIARQLSPANAEEAAKAITAALLKTKSATLQGELAELLTVVSLRLETDVAARACTQAARTLTQALDDLEDPTGTRALARGLAGIADRLDTNTASQAAATLVRSMDPGVDPSTLKQVAHTLAALSGQLPRAEAARVCGRVAKALARAALRADDFSARQDVAAGMRVVAAKVPSPEAAEAAKSLAEAVTERLGREDVAKVGELIGVLTALLPQLAPEDAGPIADALTLALSHTERPFVLRRLAEALLAIGRRLTPVDAQRTAERLTRALTTSTDPELTSALAAGLSAAADRANPADATRLCGQAADFLILALARTAEYKASQELARGLSAVLGELPEARPCLEPPSPRFSTQQLTDMLKKPLCVGLSRRAVLDRLGGRYGRRFTDQWDFVDFAQQHLELDLTSPPKRGTSLAEAGP